MTRITARFVTSKWTDNPIDGDDGLIFAVAVGKYISDDLKGEATTAFILSAGSTNRPTNSTDNPLAQRQKKDKNVYWKADSVSVQLPSAC